MELIATLPPVLGIEDLSKILRKKPSSITVDLCRAPYRLPPPCTPPGQREQIWLAEDVLDWLRAFRRPAASKPEPQVEKRRPGRPTKAEQIRRRREKERE